MRGSWRDQSGSGRPSTFQSRLKSAFVVVSTARRVGSSARPTRPMPLSTNSALPSGVMRTMPRRPLERCGDVEIAVAVKGQSLRPAQAAVEKADFALMIDAHDAVVARGGGAGDVEFARRAERQMIGGDGRLERGEDKNLAVRADLENRAAAIADEEVALGIEGEAGGDAHAFDPKLRAAVGRDAMDGAVVAAGDVEHAGLVQSQAGGIHQFGDERLHLVIGGDFVERDRHFLAALAAVGDVDIAFGVHRGVGHRMQVVGDLHAELDLAWARCRRAK